MVRGGARAGMSDGREAVNRPTESARLVQPPRVVARTFVLVVTKSILRRMSTALVLVLHSALGASEVRHCKACQLTLDVPSPDSLPDRVTCVTMCDGVIVTRLVG